MAADRLIYMQDDGGLTFGDYTLPVKKKEEATIAGDAYKVKTFKEITKLESNDSFVYESVPGTKVTDYREDEKELSFAVEGDEDAQIILGLQDDKEYKVFVDNRELGTVSTGLGGKLSISLELAGNGKVHVRVVK